MLHAIYIMLHVIFCSFAVINAIQSSLPLYAGEYLKIDLSLTHGARYLKSLASRCLHVWRQRAVVRRRLRANSEHVLKMLELGRKREVLVLWRRKTGRIKAVR